MVFEERRMSGPSTEGMTYCPRSKGWFPSGGHLNEHHLKVYPACAEEADEA